MPTIQHGKGSKPPAVGVEFELALPTPIDGLDMVKWAGLNPQGWEYTGTLFVPGTQRFKLVQTGYQPNLDGVRRKQGENNVPQGFWMKAFEEAFPSNDGNGPIGVADPSWRNPSRYARFPVLRERGEAWRRHFHWAGYGRRGRWRWLQSCK